MKKGISLVALVVTIIVLIILSATVVLTMVDDSIFDKANTAVEEQNRKEVFSEVQREVLNVQTENIGLAVGEEFAQKLQTNLNNRYATSNSTAIYDEAKDIIDIVFKLNQKEYGLTLNNKYQLNIGTTGNLEAINDDKVIEILLMYINNEWEMSEAQLLQLKKELGIENVKADIPEQISILVSDESLGQTGIYFPDCNRVYSINIGENISFAYVSEEEAPALYDWGKKINQIVTEFETAFVGKLTVEEIQQKNNDGILDE